MATPYVPYSGPIVTRAEAKARKLPRYFTGNPCPAGHIVERITANGTCRLCLNRMARATQVANPEKYKALRKAWQTKHKDRLNAKLREERKRNPERLRRNSRRWVAKNRQYTWDYYAANAEAAKARIRQWGIDNPEKVTAYHRNRRARVASAKGSHTGAEIKALLKKQNGRCVYCSKSIAKKFHADHIVSLVDGGSNWISNIQLTCPTCNMRKNRTDPLVFAARMGRLL